MYIQAFLSRLFIEDNFTSRVFPAQKHSLSAGNQKWNRRRGFYDSNANIDIAIFSNLLPQQALLSRGARRTTKKLFIFIRYSLPQHSDPIPPNQWRSTKHIFLNIS